MAPNRLYGKPMKPKKRSADDDPFWDSWEDEESSPEPVARLPSPSKQKKKKYKQLTGSVDDPFGWDGFGDTWESEKKPKRIVHRNSSPVVLPEDLFSDEESWCTSVASYEDPLKVRKRWFENHLKEHNAKQARLDAEKEQKEVLEAQKKAEKQAAKAAADAEKALAEEQWRHTVKQAYDFVALANPVQAISTLRALAQEEFVHHINQQSKKEVSQLYTALYDHWERQQTLTRGFAPRRSSDNSQDSNESNSNNENKDEKSSIESSISGDTVKVNRSTEEEDEESNGSKSTIVVDRSQTHRLNNESDEASGGTVIVVRSSSDHNCSIDGEEREISDLEETAWNSQFHSKSTKINAAAHAKRKPNNGTRPASNGNKENAFN